MGRLDRYIISEFWLPLASGVGVITGVWLGIDKFKEVFKLLAKSGASFDKGIIIIGLQIPEIVSMTAPIGVLLAAFLVFQKLSGQSEILAMRAAGASFLRIMKPVIFMGILMACTTFILSEFVVPFASPLARKMYVLSLYKDPIPTKTINSFSYFEKNARGRIRRIFYVKSFQDELLKDVIILDFSKQGLAQILTSAEGSWSSLKGGWELTKGNSHMIQQRGQKSDGNSLDLVSTFDSTFVPSKLNPKKILDKISKFKDLNFIELGKFIALHDDGSIETSKIHEAWTKFHNKFAYPISCILLAIIGACLGLVGRRQTINWGYILLGLVVFVFYMSQTIFSSFGESGRLDPFISVWIPNFIMFLMASLGIWYRTEMR